MNFQILPYWGIIIDAFQILLCGIIILVLVHNKIRYKQMILNSPVNDRHTCFSNEISKQNLKQETEQIFDSILNFISQKRLSLVNLYESQSQNFLHDAFVLDSPRSLQTFDRDKATESFNQDDSHYDLIAELGNKGLGSKDIAKRVDIPRGEVELALRLDQARKKATDRNRTMVQF